MLTALILTSISPDSLDLVQKDCQSGKGPPERYIPTNPHYRLIIASIESPVLRILVPPFSRMHQLVTLLAYPRCFD